MKKITLLLLASVFSLQITAQTDDDFTEMTRDVIKVEKKAAITEAMDFTDAESNAFWPLYNEYQSNMYGVQNKRIAIIKEYAKNYENLTNEKADQLTKAAFSQKLEALKLSKKYYAKFKKILPAGKAARFMQLENKIETLINAELAVDIPLLETN